MIRNTRTAAVIATAVLTIASLAATLAPSIAQAGARYGTYEAARSAMYRTDNTYLIKEQDRLTLKDGSDGSVSGCSSSFEYWKDQNDNGDHVVRFKRNGSFDWESALGNYRLENGIVMSTGLGDNSKCLGAPKLGGTTFFVRARIDKSTGACGRIKVRVISPNEDPAPVTLEFRNGELYQDKSTGIVQNWSEMAETGKIMIVKAGGTECPADVLVDQVAHGV